MPDIKTTDYVSEYQFKSHSDPKYQSTSLRAVGIVEKSKSSSEMPDFTAERPRSGNFSSKMPRSDVKTVDSDIKAFDYEAEMTDLNVKADSLNGFVWDEYPFENDSDGFQGPPGNARGHTEDFGRSNGIMGSSNGEMPGSAGRMKNPDGSEHFTTEVDYGSRVPFGQKQKNERLQNGKRNESGKAGRDKRVSRSKKGVQSRKVKPTKKISAKLRKPVRGAIQSLKQSAEVSAESGKGSGMNSYDLARDTFAESQKKKDQLAELVRMVVKVVKAVATAAVLPFVAVMALIALLIASIVSFFTGSGSAAGHPIPNPTTERQIIYNGLIQEFEGNTVAAIGVMCALMAESGCHANATEGKDVWGLSAEEYTEKVNNMDISKDDFINSVYDGVTAGRGYGIAQWSTVDRKKALYEFASRWSVEKAKGFDIADIEMQVEHLRATISGSYASLKEKLIKETDMEEACYLWIENYEKPSQKFSTYREKAERNIRLYAESIQEECTYDVDRGNILWPVPSVKVGSVTSKFGYRGNIGVPGATADHKGIDIGASEGSNIVAVASGTVKTVAYNSARGNYVVIDHGGGKETWYQHMQTTALVKQGESVSAGTLIGYVGQTGISKGAHLHFEVHIGGTPVDPLQYYQ